MPPADRFADSEGGREGYFYPGEVARMLNLPANLDYRQLRRMFDISRRAAGRDLPPTRVVTPRSGPAIGTQHRRSAWARFDLRDVAGIAVVLELAGGRAALENGERRLALKGIEEACNVLRELGYRAPLLQVPLARVGGAVVAVVRDSVVDPATGQLVLESAEEVVRLWEGALADPRLAAAAAAERATMSGGGVVPTALETHVVLWPRGEGSRSRPRSRP